MNIIETISVPIIVTIVYIFIEALKTAIKNEVFRDFIPIFAILIGALVGIIVYWGFPQVFIAENIYQAIIIGAASGWAATGANQTYKKIKEIKGGDENNGD